MSKSVKQERTRGYLDNLAQQRKDRRAARDLKAVVLNDVEDVMFSLPLAQDFNLFMKYVYISSLRCTFAWHHQQHRSVNAGQISSEKTIAMPVPQSEWFD